MKHFFWSTVIGATLLATGMQAATINQRRGYQQDRIAQGVASGQLTARETAHLERQEAAVNREIRRDWADGHFALGERARVQHQQNVMSREIWRDKHNAWQR